MGEFFGNFWYFIVAGGPAMWALAIAVGRSRSRSSSSGCCSSRRSTPIREALLRALGEKIAANDLAGAMKVCRQNRACLPRILEFGLKRGEKNRADITDALSIALMENLNALERNLGVIGTIAVIAPFVGLFGTVLGIIRAFQDIALKGNSTPAVVAAGVSEALITTAAGLVRRRHLGHFLQLLQVAHQGVQPGHDRRRQPARRDAALPQHRCADPDRPLPPRRRTRDGQRPTVRWHLIGSAQDDEVMAEINITPFTDVLLVLLIIFMILAALVTPPGFQKQLPDKSTTPTKSTTTTSRTTSRSTSATRASSSSTASARASRRSTPTWPTWSAGAEQYTSRSPPTSRHRTASSSACSTRRKHRRPRRRRIRDLITARAVTYGS